MDIGDVIKIITEKFGDSYKDIGFGLYILVYNVEKKSVILNFSIDNKLAKITLQSDNESNKVLLGE